MAEATHFYEPGRGHGLSHDPLNSVIAPRPIGWIASQDAAGRRNLAPYSFFNVFNYHPPIIGFSSIGYKDSVANILETGEFTWNLVTRPLAEAMNATSATVAADVDEFALAGLTPEPSRLIRVPRVAETPVAFECRLSQRLQLCTAAGSAVETWLVLGEVVGVHIAERLLVDGIYDTVAAQTVLRGGGPAGYFGLDTAERFYMHRPGAER